MILHTGHPSRGSCIFVIFLHCAFLAAIYWCFIKGCLHRRRPTKARLSGRVPSPPPPQSQTEKVPAQALVQLLRSQPEKDEGRQPVAGLSQVVTAEGAQAVTNSELRDGRVQAVTPEQTKLNVRDTTSMILDNRSHGYSTTLAIPALLATRRHESLGFSQSPIPSITGSKTRVKWMCVGAALFSYISVDHG
jgi:hypothetical protein